MPRATGKDHARINLDIWGDEPYMDLTPAAQHLYFVLWTSPQLSYCGAGDWHPGKIAARAKGWTAAAVCAAAAELSSELFLIIDVDTDEFLLRSWIKHDGLWRIPNMAVSMANARAELASRTLRAVVVHEVSKLREREKDSNSWARGAVVNMLANQSIDPVTLPPYPGLNPGSNPTVNPRPNPGANSWGQPKANPGPNPPSNPGPTPAPAPTPTSLPPIGGSESRERHQDTDPDPNAPLPSPFCSKHPGGTERPCPDCGAARRRREAVEEQRANAAAEARTRFLDAVAACEDCDELGWTDVGNSVERCPKHDWEHTHA